MPGGVITDLTAPSSRGLQAPSSLMAHVARVTCMFKVPIAVGRGGFQEAQGTAPALREPEVCLET